MTQHLTRRHLLALTSGALVLNAAGLHAETAAATEAATITDFGIGDVNAKVKMVEYLSFTCPHCAHFHGDVLPKLKADYIDTGKVRLEYHEVYFDQLGLLGAMLARCGGEMRYFGITDMLYDKQMDWAGAGDMSAAVDALKKIGLAAGMEDAAMDACLRDQTVAEALVAHYQANIAKDFPNDTFGGTPSFIINGAQHSNMDYAELQAILDAELAK
jgi:protein-disulfide isomerase